MVLIMSKRGNTNTQNAFALYTSGNLSARYNGRVRTNGGGGGKKKQCDARFFT